MKIAYIASPNFPFHKPRPEAEAMIQAGIAQPFVEAAPARLPDAKWAVSVRSIDKQPYIAASCSSCGNRVQFTGPTAHRTQQFRHCGVSENAPEHIQEQYVEQRANWKPKPSPESARTEAVPFEVLSHF
jgi:hypothetical protein